MTHQRTTLVTIALAAVALSGASQAQVLSIGSETISTGGVATVALDISGLGGGTALGAFDVNVGFNASLLSFASAAYGDPTLGDQLNLEGFGPVTATTPGSGSTELFELSLDSASVLAASQASSFTLATLSFDTLKAGTSALDLSVNALSDQNGSALTPTLHDGSITVTSAGPAQAPEIDAGSASGAALLLLGGLAVLRGRSSGAPRRVAIIRRS